MPRQAHDPQRTEPQTERTAHKEPPVLPRFAAECDLVHNCLMGDEGLEPRGKTPEKSGIHPERGTESGTVGATGALARLAEVWPSLDDGTRRTILRLAGIE